MWNWAELRGNKQVCGRLSGHPQPALFKRRLYNQPCLQQARNQKINKSPNKKAGALRRRLQTKPLNQSITNLTSQSGSLILKPLHTKQLPQPPGSRIQIHFHFLSQQRLPNPCVSCPRGSVLKARSISLVASHV